MYSSRDVIAVECWDSVSAFHRGYLANNLSRWQNVYLHAGLSLPYMAIFSLNISRNLRA